MIPGRLKRIALASSWPAPQSQGAMEERKYITIVREGICYQPAHQSTHYSRTHHPEKTNKQRCLVVLFFNKKLADEKRGPYFCGRGGSFTREPQEYSEKILTGASSPPAAMAVNCGVTRDWRYSTCLGQLFSPSRGDTRHRTS